MEGPLDIEVKVQTADRSNPHNRTLLTLKIGRTARAGQVKAKILKSLQLYDGEYALFVDKERLEDDDLLVDQLRMFEDLLLSADRKILITLRPEFFRKPELHSQRSYLALSRTPKMQLLKVTVEHTQQQFHAEVDFDQPLSQLLEELCRFFEFDAKNACLVPPGHHDGNIDRSKSLQDLGVEVNGSVVLRILKNNQADRKERSESTSQVTSSSSVWDEPEDHDENIKVGVSNSGTSIILSATLNKLIERLTIEKDHDHLQLMKVFIYTYQSFATPRVFLEKLIDRYHVPKTYSKEQAKNIQLKICNVLKNWIELSSSDFANDVMASRLAQFLGMLDSDGNSILSKKLRDAMIKQTAAERERLSFMIDEEAPEAKVPRNIHSPNMNFFDVDDEEIARQITLLDFNMFARITPSELLNQSWSKPDMQHRSPHVLAMIDRFNNLSQWVATMIVKIENVKIRAKMMIKCINIMKHLKAMNNFSSLLAFIAGFNNAAVSRLMSTKSQLSTKLQEELESFEKLMSGEKSFKTYRAMLHQADPPMVPYLGVYLSDLTFIEDGNLDMIGNLINFEKRFMVYRVLLEVLTYQQKPYNFRVIPRIGKDVQTFASKNFQRRF
eukprot:TRINITY_DN3971_c0_g1_i2.p1 TRINITY_DN3971_c0_g1~~TRINITY_DN3971_c0_g1_i2.p1  ORF type:complete len:622 (-),score=142.26 TRINITY_DN3971_c0_g1_i2:1171-3003(-)